MPYVELPQTEFKVVILGDTHTGKTSLVLRFTEGYYRENSRSPTVGAFFLTKRVQTSSGVTAKVQIWDTAGQSQFRQMAPIYWRNSAAILICYDVTNVESWNVALEWMKELRGDSNVLEKNIVLVLVATKSDLLNVDTDADGYYDIDYDKGIHKKGAKRNMVSMAHVEQVLQSLNNQGHLHAHGPTSTTVTTGVMHSISSPKSSNHQMNNNIPMSANYPIQSLLDNSSGGNSNHINNVLSPHQHLSQSSNNNQGQILYIHTSARKDENVDLLFQKVAEEVLSVREQERTLWMNHGIKYKHYSSMNTSSIVTPPMLGPIDNGHSTMNHLQEEQKQQHNQYNSYNPTFRDDHMTSSNSGPLTASASSTHASEYNNENQLDQGRMMTSSTTTSQQPTTSTPSRKLNVKNLTIDTTNINNNYSSYDRSHSKDDVQRMQSVETSRSTSSSQYTSSGSGLCYSTCATTSDDDVAACVVS